MHVYYVERIFDRPEPLRRIGLLAATHHERMDGSGYHRGVGGTMLDPPARVLAAADAYHAMTQPRPHRDADDRRRGRPPAAAPRPTTAGSTPSPPTPCCPPPATAAAAGPAPAARPASPPGRATCSGCWPRGCPTRAIARRLGISPKTVGNHVEHIYTKLGVSNRAAAAMRAMQHGLVGAATTTTYAAD